MTDLPTLGVDLVDRPVVEDLVLRLGVQPEPSLQVRIHYLLPLFRAPCQRREFPTTRTLPSAYRCPGLNRPGSFQRPKF